MLTLTAIAGTLQKPTPLVAAMTGVDAATASTPKNIVLILTDDQTYASVDQILQTSGGPVAVMPYTHGRDWLRFDNAFLNVPLCCPSRASILTGLYSHHTGVEGILPPYGGQNLNDSSTLATWLKTAPIIPPYRTSLLGKYLNLWPTFQYPPTCPASPLPSRPPGWDNFQVFCGDVSYCNYTLFENDKLVNYTNGCTTQPTNYSTDVLSTKASAFIDKRFDALTGVQEEPFFLEIAVNAPHAPRTPAVRYSDKFTGVPMPRASNFNEADVTDKPPWLQAIPRLIQASPCPTEPPDAECNMDKDRRAEYRTLRAVDDLVKSVFDKLAARNVLSNTVVVFMTDNGVAFGEHRFQRKRCPYEECLRTPFLVHYPNQAGRHVPQLVQNVDLAPTFAEIAGVPPPGSGPGARPATDGRTLLPLFENSSTAWRTGVLLHWKGGPENPLAGMDNDYDVPEYWAVRTDRYKYVEYVDPSQGKELYDLQLDPAELENSADDPTFAAVQAELATQLAELKAAAPSN